jgi:hypothetical protein
MTSERGICRQRIEIRLPLDGLFHLARTADHRWRCRLIEQGNLCHGRAEKVAMQPPMSAALVRQRKAIATFLRRGLLGIETFVDDDAALVEENRTKNVGIETEAGSRHAEQLVHVVELKAELQMLFDNVFDRHLARDGDTPSQLVFGQKRSGIALDLLLSKVRHFPRHRSSPFICIVEPVAYPISRLLPAVPAGPVG